MPLISGQAGVGVVVATSGISLKRMLSAAQDVDAL
jgi:hypothetical protein